MLVPTKKAWYDIQRAGIFNTTRSFTVEEYLKVCGKFSDDKMFCIRTMGGGGGKFTCLKNIYMMSHLGSGTPQSGWSNLKVSEQAPDDAILVQGEYNGEWARISFEKTPMRFALQKSEHTISRVQLLGVIGYERYRMLEDILEAYPDAVIEFSVYSRRVGIHNEDMIIWEIRHY